MLSQATYFISLAIISSRLHVMLTRKSDIKKTACIHSRVDYIFFKVIFMLTTTINTFLYSVASTLCRSFRIFVLKVPTGCHICVALLAFFLLPRTKWGGGSVQAKLWSFNHGTCSPTIVYVSSQRTTKDCNAVL